jgi:hypothetical protein
MRIFLIVLILSGAGLAQSTPPKATCEDKATLDACRSFNDALEDDDARIASALERRQHVLICFRPSEDVFLLIAYDSFEANLQKENAPSSGNSGSIDFVHYRNGNANLGNESLFAIGQWTPVAKEGKTHYRFSGQSLIPNDDGKASIDDANITISHSFKRHWGLGEPTTHYVLSIELPSRRFVESFTLPDAATGQSKREDSGECFVLKK